PVVRGPAPNVWMRPSDQDGSARKMTGEPAATAASTPPAPAMTVRGDAPRCTSARVAHAPTTRPTSTIASTRVTLYGLLLATPESPRIQRTSAARPTKPAHAASRRRAAPPD